MSNRTYPHRYGKSKIKPRRGEAIKSKCCVCGAPAAWVHDIQTSWFRGDDELRTTCDEHKTKTASELLDAKEAKP